MQATTLAIEAFPQTIIPNKLVKELRTLAKTAGLSIPLVDELAADIFQGKFSENYLHSAHEAASLLRGTLYERYYRIDFNAVANLSDLVKPSRGPSTSPGFASMSADLANAGDKRRSSVAANGTILEQSQILTTHNLASLFKAFDLKHSMKAQLPDLAKKCFKWICRRLQLRFCEWRQELHAIKNSAYAWRQMIFFLSLIEPDEVNSFLEWASEHLSKQDADFQQRFQPAWQGLVATAGSRTAGVTPELDKHTGANSGRVIPFLGWTTGRHWLRAPESAIQKK